MKAELGRIVSDTSLGLRWEAMSSPPTQVAGQTVSVSLLGRCIGAPPEVNESGPLGWTKSINQRVLPYVEVDCGRIRTLLDPAWGQESGARRDLHLGRAMGRVLAHELAHALSRTEHHSSEGLRKRALSARDLIDGSYELESSDFERPGLASRLTLAREQSPDPSPAGVVEGGGR